MYDSFALGRSLIKLLSIPFCIAIPSYSLDLRLRKDSDKTYTEKVFTLLSGRMVLSILFNKCVFQVSASGCHIGSGYRRTLIFFSNNSPALVYRTNSTFPVFL
jgi:hypothetical protein